ncbi:MAG TPA: hypothetical protein VLL52_11400 [Anaerolineae bacterium]|nr:hypothetical protein [Anaerolineae bacterium]
MEQQPSVNNHLRTDSPPEKLIPIEYIIGGTFFLILLGVVFVVILIWLAGSFPTGIETVRDILIIALAIESCIFGIILMMLLITMIRLVNMLEFEIKPILEKTNQTINTVQGTTSFVSQNVVKPTITARSYFAGFQRGLRTLFGNPDRNLPD